MNCIWTCNHTERGICVIAQTRLMKTSKQRVTEWACILMNVSEIINRASSSSSLAVLHAHTPFQLFLFALAVVFSGQSYVGQRSLWFLWLTLMLLTHQHCNQPQLYEERWIGGNSINGEQMKNLRWTNSSWNSKNLSWHRMYKPANAWYLTNTNNTVKRIQVLNLWTSTRSPMISLEFIFGLLRVL